MMKASRVLGKDWTRVGKYKRYMEEAGFEDVVERRFEWPVGTWAKGERQKRLGALYREDLLRALEPFSMLLFMKGLGMRKEEVDEIVGAVREEIMSDKIHVYVPV
jgi:hypothetical protein